MSSKMVGSASEWSGVLKDFFRQMDDGSITLAMVQSFLERRNSSVSSILADWQAFYQAEFGIALDTAYIHIPERRKGFDRLIVVAAGLKIQQVYDRCKKLFPCWKYTNRDLDEAVPTNDRMPVNGSYAIWIRDRVEADEELKNLSANDLKRKNIPGTTLLERLLFELKYFRETGKHLDVVTGHSVRVRGIMSAMSRSCTGAAASSGCTGIALSAPMPTCVPAR